MAAGAWVVHDSYLLKLINGTADIDAATCKVRLYSSASNIATTSVTAPTNELSTANGYTAGGAATTVTVSGSGGTITVDATDVSWTASGGSITARFAGLYDETTNELVAHCLLDTTPADVTATDTNAFNVNFNASGVFTVARA